MQAIAFLQETRTHRSLNPEFMSILGVMQELGHSSLVIFDRNQHFLGMLGKESAIISLSIEQLAVNLGLNHFAHRVLPDLIIRFDLVVLANHDLFKRVKLIMILGFRSRAQDHRLCPSIQARCVNFRNLVISRY